jgi:hypothetical protein
MSAAGRDGMGIGHNRVRRLLRWMGLEAIYPKPRLSMANRMERRVYLNQRHTDFQSV